MEFQLKGKKAYSIGKLPLDQYELRSLFRDQQGNFMTGMSKKLDFIILGEGPTAKQLAKAKATGVPLISYAEFQKLVNQEYQRFDLDDLAGSQAPDELLAALSQKNWNLFRQLVVKEAKSEPLIALLAEHEVHHGITQVHHFCSAQLAGQYCLELIHPFHHTGDIRNHDVSPDKKWLVTACDENHEFEDRRAIVQVWDIEQGQPVNQFSIRGGVGAIRADEQLNGLQWSPDSQLIGMNKNLNGIAVYRPNGARLSEAYITNGIAYAIGFSWANDSQHVAIHWPYYEKLGVSEDTEVEKNITWMPAEVTPPRGTNHRESEKQCVPGKESDRPLTNKRRFLKQLPQEFKDKIPHASANFYYVTPTRLVVISKRAVRFYNRAGALLQDYTQYDWNPIGSRSKLQRTNSLSPLFPIDDNRARFGKVLHENAVLIPEATEVPAYISASLSRRYAWPIRWIESVPLRTEDTDEAW